MGWNPDGDGLPPAQCLRCNGGVRSRHDSQWSRPECRRRAALTVGEAGDEHCLFQGGRHKRNGAPRITPFQRKQPLYGILPAWIDREPVQRVCRKRNYTSGPQCLDRRRDGGG